MTFSDKVEGGLSIDKIIEKFIPVIGALCFTIGLGYLLYTSVSINFPIELKLGLGFFSSLVLIGGSFSFSDKLRYFADVIIGAGILLLYGTLIYGARTSDIGNTALIPELAALFVASIVTIGTAYFASLRKSKVILALSILGSYLTPFVIGGEWGSSALSFNSYLIYFFIGNVSIFLLGKEIALKDLIPLNIIGLFIGSSSLYLFGYESNSLMGGFWQSDSLSIIILSLIVIFSIFSIAISAKKFESKEESFLTIAYIVPLLWFMLNVSLLGRQDIGDWWLVGTYGIISAAYFLGWHYVRSLETNYQHVSLYAGGILALIIAGIELFPELNYISSTIIAYVGLFFAGLFFLDTKKWERFVAYMIFALVGGFFGVYHFYTKSSVEDLGFLFITLTLLPASCSYLLVQKAEEPIYSKLIDIATLSSIVSILVMGLATVFDLIDIVELTYIIGIIPALGLVGTAYFSSTMNSDKRSAFLQIGMAFLAFGFASKFFYLISMLIPRQADGLSIFESGNIILYSVSTLLVLFAGLSLSRRLQIERKEKRPSFLLVIFGYSTLLLFVNYLLIVGMNDLGVSTGNTGGVRAVATTIWWILLASFMMTIGVKNGALYRSEKLLGLLLIALTIGKIIFYDMETMATDKKIVVLMIVGGILMTFSYFFHTKEWLKGAETKLGS